MEYLYEISWTLYSEIMEAQLRLIMLHLFINLEYPKKEEKKDTKST